MNNTAHLDAEMAALFASKQRFLIVATGTTGVPRREPDAQIIEIACMDQDGQVVFSSLLRLDIPISARAPAIHGITEADLAGAPRFIEVWPRLQELLSRAEVVYCYHAAFVFDMLRLTARRYKLLLPEQIQKKPWRCLMTRYAHCSGEPGDDGDDPWQKLGRACAQFGVEMSEAHGATGKCVATLSLMKALATRGAAAGVPEATGQASTRRRRAASTLRIVAQRWKSPCCQQHPWTASFQAGDEKIRPEAGQKYETEGLIQTGRAISVASTSEKGTVRTWQD